ncbi:hypothetical protein EVJ29_06880 [Exiguobacterium sp. SH4S7]|uniref:HIT family protein n=1 Tax=Exiguobacterium sp. SH4S7 TaxID=2510958 RepID=UPI00103E08F7|nr:HIT domain-containing protein [Exiguobacterium sp. SH4S7]TCI36216.1 hypothetical protein EVJ29_06880 [Exiguobacterium sp. SH4S7]
MEKSIALSKFEEKFRTNDLLIFESDHWKWCLRPSHPVIGSSILFIKRPCSSLSEVTDEEALDLMNMNRIIEKTLKSKMNFTILNYFVLMLVDKHFHFHIIPRFEHPIIFVEQKWIDKDWPNPPKLNAHVLEDDLLELIKNELVSAI